MICQLHQELLEANFNRIKSVLAEKGKKSKFLADALEVNYATVSRWCTNSSQPSVDTLFEIADLLGCEARDLLVLKGDLIKKESA